MTGRSPRRPAPTAAEVQEIGLLLVKYWGASARKALAPWLNEKSTWDTALREVRILLKKTVTDIERGHKIPITVRNTLNTFAVKYGTETHGVKGAEPADLKKTFRFGQLEWEDIEKAAAAAGMTPTDYVRGAALRAARRETTE